MKKKDNNMNKNNKNIKRKKNYQMNNKEHKWKRK